MIPRPIWGADESDRVSAAGKVGGRPRTVNATTPRPGRRDRADDTAQEVLRSSRNIRSSAKSKVGLLNGSAAACVSVVAIAAFRYPLGELRQGQNFLKDRIFGDGFLSAPWIGPRRVTRYHQSRDFTGTGSIRRNELCLVSLSLSLAQKSPVRSIRRSHGLVQCHFSNCWIAHGERRPGSALDRNIALREGCCPRPTAAGLASRRRSVDPLDS